MKVLFVNTQESRCGVHQYGESLLSVMANELHDFTITRVAPSSSQEFLSCYDSIKPDVTLYNWQSGIGGWMSEAPFKNAGRQVLIYHDLEARFDDFDAIIFSDPTMNQSGNWHPIGRPLRRLSPFRDRSPGIPRVGVNGFIGAWARNVVSQLASEFERCLIRLHLPYAYYGDRDGVMARSSAEACRSMLPAGFEVEVSHEFMAWDDLQLWLSENDINCYFRDMTPWRGVSSSIDAAMCARRPISVNRCQAFRHMHDCSPSICVEDRTIREIISTGMSPLVKKYDQFSGGNVAGQVRKVLESVVNRA